MVFSGELLPNPIPLKIQFPISKQGHVTQLSMAILQVHVPAYNEEKSIEKSVRSILDQSFTDFTLTIYDNKSTDDTLSICKDLAKQDSRILINEAPINSGALMNGYRIRCGYNARYVAIRSANDFIACDFFKESVALLENDPSVSLAYSHGFVFKDSPENATPIADQFKIDTRGLSQIDSAKEVMIRYTHPFALWGVYRRSAFERCRPYQYTYGGDHIVIAEMSLYGAIAPIPSRLDYRALGTQDIVSGLQANAASQLEEHIRQTPKNSYYYGTKQILPFTDMAWGHAEMFSLAMVDENSKHALIKLAVDILKLRFGNFMQDEANRYIEFISSTLGNLEKLPPSKSLNVYWWLHKAKKELDKIRFLNTYPNSRLSEMEVRATALQVRFSNN